MNSPENISLPRHGTHKPFFITVGVLCLLAAITMFSPLQSRIYSVFSSQTPLSTVTDTPRPVPHAEPPAQPAVPASPPPAPPPPAHDYAIPPVKDGAVPVISRIPTKEKVVFLTIDDGIVKSPDAMKAMQDNGVKASFFLVHRFINTNPTYFAELSKATGSDIQNHTYDHYLLVNYNYDQQKDDICKNADIFAQWFGKRPVFMRPSGGLYNATSLKAAADCGMKALVLWSATVDNGRVNYQVGNSLRPGDIVLMHFRSTFKEDLEAFVAAAKAAGLQPDLLINWL